MNLVAIASKTASTVARSEITKALAQLVVGAVASTITGKTFDRYVTKPAAVVGEN